MATKLKYVSKGGTVLMGGAMSHIGLIEPLNGFELPSKKYETVEFAGENGVTTTGSKDMSRIMTVSGDIYGGQKTLMEIMKAFYYEGTLYCEFGNIKRKIDCKVKNLDDIVRHGNSGINGFTVQFEADYPYFNDFKDTVTTISSSRDLINGTFMLPCVWTEYLQQGIVKNTGDKIAYPLIEIKTDTAPIAEEATITITNNTTGAFIILNHVMREGEVVTLNLKTRRIKSSIDGNITNHITDDTVLQNFYLDIGENDISFKTSEENQTLTANVTFNRLYIMAVR